MARGGTKMLEHRVTEGKKFDNRKKISSKSQFPTTLQITQTNNCKHRCDLCCARVSREIHSNLPRVTLEIILIHL